MFPSPEGTFMRRSNFRRRVWLPATTAAGLEGLRFHDLRHTHASLLLRDRVPIKVVSERLGHANPAFTMTTYQHVIPGMQEDAAAAFGQLLTASLSNSGEKNIAA